MILNSIKSDLDEQKEIKHTLLDYYEAFHSKNWKKFGEFLSNDFRYFTDKTVTITKR